MEYSKYPTLGRKESMVRRRSSLVQLYGVEKDPPEIHNYYFYLRNENEIESLFSPNFIKEYQKIKVLVNPSLSLDDITNVVNKVFESKKKRTPKIGEIGRTESAIHMAEKFTSRIGEAITKNKVDPNKLKVYEINLSTGETKKLPSIGKKLKQKIIRSISLSNLMKFNTK